jgi:hypothetical protein
MDASPRRNRKLHGAMRTEAQSFFELVARAHSLCLSVAILKKCRWNVLIKQLNQEENAINNVRAAGVAYAQYPVAQICFLASFLSSKINKKT